MIYAKVWSDSLSDVEAFRMMFPLIAPDAEQAETTRAQTEQRDLPLVFQSFVNFS